MRILLVNDAYPPMIGGATRAAQQLGRQLSARGHEVAVATAWQRNLPAREDDAGVEVHRLRGVVSRIGRLSADPVRYTPPPFPDPELVWRLRRVVRRFRPDIVHSYGWLTYSAVPALYGTGVPLLFAAREYGNICPTRTLIRAGRDAGSVSSGPAWGKCHECSVAFYGKPKGLVAATSVLGLRRPLRARVDALHSTSRFTEQVTLEFLMGSRSVLREIVPDFREDELTGPADPDIMRRLPEEPYMLFVGSFRRIKGDEVLLEAYRRLERPPPLVMIGARSAEPAPDAPPGVTLLTDVPHDTVMAAWDRALFGVTPSVVPEALGNVVHEGMSRGKAVIGTHPGGHVDMIDDGVNGLLVPSGDVDALVAALQRLGSDPDLCARMGAAASERARQFTDTVVVPQYEDLYRRTVAATSRRPWPGWRASSRRTA